MIDMIDLNPAECSDAADCGCEDCALDLYELRVYGIVELIAHYQYCDHVANQPFDND